METITFIEGALALLWRASWQASVLALLVLAAQWIFGRRLAPKWRYALWSLVVLRLLLPVTPSSAWSVFNVGNVEHFDATGLQRWARGELWNDGSNSPQPATGESQPPNGSVENPTPVTTPANAGPAASAPQPSFLQSTLNFLRRHLVWIWFLGVLALSMRLAWGNYLFSLQLRRRKPITEPSVLALLEECRQKVGVRRPLTLIEAPELDSPALFGCFRLKLLLPEKLIEHFSPAEMRHVFLHELAHVRRRDAAVNWLTTILQTLHWFNPVLWFAFHRMRADRELACDALALAHAHDGETKPYGQTVIKVLEGFTQPTAIPGLVGILEDKKQIKERITMIAQFKPATGWPILALALVTLLGCVSLTDANRKEAATAAASNKAGSGVRMNSSGLASGQTILQKLSTEKFGEWAKWVTDPATRPSPDGRYLAFINWSFGNLAVYDTKTGESRDLTTDGTWDPRSRFCDSIAWSPDGKQIAYGWFKEGEGVDLRIIDRSGGKPRFVVSYDKDVGFEAHAWSSDGRYILGPARKGAGTNKVFQIVRVEVANRTVKVLKELLEAKGWFRVALSPDDRQIAYSSATELRAMNIDGLNDRVLLENPAGRSDPIWMPDGQHLVFSSNRSGTEGLWAMPMQQGEAKGAPILVREGFFTSRLWGCSNDGTLYWLTTTPRANIFVADVDFAAGTMQTSRQVSLRFDGRSRAPRWSADGSTLSYVSREFSGAKYATHVIHETASGKERDVRIPEVYYGGFFGPPQWSADYRTLYASAVLEGNESRGLYSFDAQTGKPTLISEGDVGTPNLSPEGSHLIYLKVTSSGTNRIREVVERDLRSIQERVIRRSNNIPGHSPVGPNPLLSRDGARLAYLESDGKGGRFLQIISRADGATRTLWENIGGRGAAVLDWLPDNRRVLISVQDDQGTQQLYVVDTETKSARPFAQPVPEDDRIFQLSIHPDGKRAAFGRESSIQEVWAMKNFLPPDELAAK
jgi:beta-lactamase regulating signal transducer with metallopeptidase domain/Tol biopolymer transport system component